MTTTTTNPTATTTNTDTDVIDSNSKLLGVYGPIGDNGNGNGKSKRKNKKQDNNNDNKAISTVGENTKKPFYIQKYSKDVPLLEAVIINRQPFFLQVIMVLIHRLYSCHFFYLFSEAKTTLFTPPAPTNNALCINLLISCLEILYLKTYLIKYITSKKYAIWANHSYICIFYIHLPCDLYKM